MKPKIYIAGPLFSDAERAFNARLAELLDKYFNVFLPQESGFLLREMLADGEPLEDSMRAIFDRDIAAIQSADYVLIVLDGRAVDEGASFELGVAFAEGKKCIALQTDWRQLLPVGHNPMLVCAVSHILHSIDELKSWAEKVGSLPVGVTSTR